MIRSYRRIPGFLDYVIACYAGTEQCRSNNEALQRRMFLWEDGGEVRLGNVEAFVDHLIQKFDLKVTQRGCAASLGKLFVCLGEVAGRLGTHGSPHPPTRKERRPAPEYVVIKKAV